MRNSISFVVGAIAIVSDYAQAVKTAKIEASSLLEWSITSSTLEWNLSSCGKTTPAQFKFDKIPASVPGQVHMDLMKMGILGQDPLFRDNELQYAWVAQNCWAYESEPFDLSGINLTDNSEPLFLRLGGVDTSANIFVNGNLVAHTQNGLRSHTIPIDKSVLTTSNKVKVEIESGIDAALNNASAYPYAVPAVLYYNTWSEPSKRNFLRKSPKDFGWDWGPSFVPSGLSGEVAFV